MIIFGGSFDPIHIGHVRVMSCLKQFMPDQKILVVPCLKNPLKRSVPYARAFDRLNMLILTRLRYSTFTISTIELEKRFIYTYLTVMELRKTVKGKLFFVMGADSFNSLGRWRNYSYLRENLEFIIVKRQNYPINNQEGFNYRVLSMNKVPVSSNNIRNRVSKALSIKGLVTKEVGYYISSVSLYMHG
ncbi:MAG: nicotinate (nicotinamide) nucleotide adenylyltransferase [Planctomycetes bacterium]|nr:nicotinate (nicotinamide) nucleotide adenylyltransferase [Planctomycetota bacterium]